MKLTAYGILFILTGILLFASCWKDNAQLSPREAAESYYASLISGDVDAYMQGMADYDSLPDDYRSQLRDMFLQYLDGERRQRGGIVSATALRDTIIDSLLAHVFIELLFGDSTHEEVGLPLVRTPDGWRMK